MQKIIEIFNSNFDVIILGIISSILATIFVLITRNLFFKIIHSFPSNKLFNYIKNSKEKCLIFQVRLQDKDLKGDFLIPVPNFSSFPNQKNNYDDRKLTTFVLSADDSSAVAMILNTLGKIGRTENIYLTYVDQDYNIWEHPMFLIGGSWKLNRVFETLSPYYILKNNKFIINETKESFFQKDIDDDLGLLEKVYNSDNNKPIWIAMGMRGAGTVAAAYSLVRWWSIFAKLYGKQPFGTIVQFSDKDGWQKSSIISYYPKPKFIRRVLYLRSYAKLKKLTKKY